MVFARASRRPTLDLCGRCAAPMVAQPAARSGASDRAAGARETALRPAGQDGGRSGGQAGGPRPPSVKLIFRRDGVGAAAAQTTVARGPAGDAGVALSAMDHAPLMGQDRLLGGVLGAAGRRYGVPGHANRVLRMTAGHRRRRFDRTRAAGPVQVAAGDRRPKRRVSYGLPCHSDSVLKIDCNASPPAITTFGESVLKVDAPGPWKWHGGVLSPIDQRIYAIPQFAESVLKIDTATEEVSTIGGPFPGASPTGSTSGTAGCWRATAHLRRAAARLGAQDRPGDAARAPAGKLAPNADGSGTAASSAATAASTASRRTPTRGSTRSRRRRAHPVRLHAARATGAVDERNNRDGAGDDGGAENSPQVQVPRRRLLPGRRPHLLRTLRAPSMFCGSRARQGRGGRDRRVAGRRKGGLRVEQVAKRLRRRRRADLRHPASRRLGALRRAGHRARRTRWDQRPSARRGGGRAACSPAAESNCMSAGRPRSGSRPPPTPRRSRSTAAAAAAAPEGGSLARRAAAVVVDRGRARAARERLEADGYVVLPAVLSRDECAAARREDVVFVEGVSPAVRGDAPDTWYPSAEGAADPWPITRGGNRSHMFQDNGAGWLFGDERELLAERLLRLYGTRELRGRRRRASPSTGRRRAAATRSSARRRTSAASRRAPTTAAPTSTRATRAPAGIQSSTALLDRRQEDDGASSAGRAPTAAAARSPRADLARPLAVGAAHRRRARHAARRRPRAAPRPRRRR